MEPSPMTEAIIGAAFTVSNALGIEGLRSVFQPYSI